MRKTPFTTITIMILSCIYNFCLAQTTESLTQRMDSLFANGSQKPFNGIVCITQNGKAVYSKISGYSDFEKKTPLTVDDQFVIGSISKQFTAAIVLHEYEKGHLDLHLPIKHYLPELSESWADTVTTHHLLCHTHGIVALDKPTMFAVGTQCGYSNLGYNLLATIAEKTSGKSFITLSKELFKLYDMHHTFHPELKEYKRLVKGYIENEQGELQFTDETFSQRQTATAFQGSELYPAAATFISTIDDLVLWNKHLFAGNLLKESTFKAMTTKQDNAIRKHSLFGSLQYGYGITVDDNGNTVRWGQTGYAPGFVTMNFYFPQSQTAVIILENVNYDVTEIRKTFYYPLQVLELLKQMQFAIEAIY